MKTNEDERTLNDLADDDNSTTNEDENNLTF